MTKYQIVTRIYEKGRYKEINRSKQKYDTRQQAREIAVKYKAKNPQLSFKIEEVEA